MVRTNPERETTWRAVNCEICGDAILVSFPKTEDRLSYTSDVYCVKCDRTFDIEYMDTYSAFLARETWN